MTMSAAFEAERERLRQTLAPCHTPEDAARAAQQALTRAAQTAAAEEPEERGRQRIQAISALLKDAPQLLAAASAKGELVLEPVEEKGLQGKLPKGVQWGGLAVLAALAVGEAVSGRMTAALLAVIGALLLMGAKLFAAGEKNRAVARGIPQVDADALIRELQALCRAADECLQDWAAIEKEGQLRLSAAADDAMLGLLSDLMEAKASGRAELAQASLNEASDYLAGQGIEAVDYDPAHAGWFDILPTMGETRTLRPALTREGKLLRRGVAAAGRGA